MRLLPEEHIRQRTDAVKFEGYCLWLSYKLPVVGENNSHVNNSYHIGGADIHAHAPIPCQTGIPLKTVSPK